MQLPAVHRLDALDGPAAVPEEKLRHPVERGHLHGRVERVREPLQAQPDPPAPVGLPAPERELAQVALDLVQLASVPPLVGQEAARLGASK